MGQGATSIVPLVINRGIESGSIMSLQRVVQRAQVWVDLLAEGSRRNPSRSPAPRPVESR